MKRPYVFIMGIMAFFLAIYILYANIPSANRWMQEKAMQALSKGILPVHKTEVYDVRQIVSKDTNSERIIMWHSDIAEEDAVVEYRRKGGADLSAVKATSRAFTEDKKTIFIHEASVTNLAPRSEYEYRVGYKNKRSDWKELRTGGEDELKVLLYPDSQSADYSGWAALVKASWERNKDAHLAVSIGDLVDNGESFSQWSAWFSSISPWADTIPFAPVLGNHEAYTLDWKVREPLAYRAYFSLPENGNTDLKGYYYSFDYGDVHFVVLYTLFRELDDLLPQLSGAQLRWLKEDLEKTRKKWKIVLMHKDVLLYNNTKRQREPGINDLGYLFMPIFDEFGVDAVFSGHYHTYRRRGHILNFERNEKGPLYVLTGVAGDVRYPNLWIDHPLDVAVAPQPESGNYMVLTFTKDSMTMKSYLSDGTLIDDYSMRK